MTVMCVEITVELYIDKNENQKSSVKVGQLEENNSTFFSDFQVNAPTKRQS